MTRSIKDRLCSLIAIFLIAGGAGSLAAQTTGSSIALVPIATGLQSPVAITHTPNDSRLFITLQGGKVMIHDGTRVLATPYLDISRLVSCCGERGLLSIAFHPRYAQNGFFYVNYTGGLGDTVIARYKVSATNRDRADPGSETIILEIDQPYSNHNGGQLQFGPDGYLYIGMGDGGAGGDPQNRAQNLMSLLGKMLRIDVDRGARYEVPSSNPFVGQSGAAPEIWSLGLRNPWRFSFDRINGDLWIADVGQSALEEVDLQRADSRGGQNYGWRRMEGTQCYNPATNCNDGALTLPVIEYGRSMGCSITGGYRYRGSRYQRLQGLYIYGDFCSGTIWGASENAAGKWTPSVLVQSSLSISTFGEDLVGELYVADIDKGIVYQIVDTEQRNAPRRRAARR
ncbi:MAG TPA: PQQ-dependent sugar dehydrogenase [Thermoanaerobaculia bacterium]|nr:PQQ-dependent sugar dehydrogenase [Thermoanaerobaculia bacterium]